MVGFSLLEIKEILDLHEQNITPAMFCLIFRGRNALHLTAPGWFVTMMR
jgi:hypothetical protein